MKTKAKKTLQTLWNLLFTVGFALLIGSAGLGGCASENGVWYTMADDAYVHKHETGGSPIDLSGAGGMEYSYTIPCWSPAGKKQELTFGTDEIIPEGTCLQIETQFLRGVMSWKEISSSEIPEDILHQIHMTLNKESAL